MADNNYSLDLERSSSQYARKVSPLTNAVTTGDLTAEAYINLESMAALAPVVTVGGTGETEAENQVWNLIVETNGGLSLRWEYGAGTNEDVFSTTTGLVSTSTWVHVAATRNTSTKEVKFYKDGSLIDTVGYTNNATGGSTSDLLIGADGNLTVFLDGLIDEVRVWNDIRTAGEISSNLQKDVTGQTGLVGYYKLENNYTDTAGNNNLSAGNSPVFSSTVPFANYQVDSGLSVLLGGGIIGT